MAKRNVWQTLGKETRRKLLYQITKRVFSLGDKYDILDGNNTPAYHVQGKFFSLGNKLSLMDNSGAEVVRIEQRLLSLVSEYDIYRDGQIAAVVKKKVFSLLTPRFTIDGSGGSYEMQGDWLNWNYTITQGGQVVARISRQLALFQDRYGVAIEIGADAPLLLAIAIVMDEVMHPDGKD